jgi:hypothetical protein
MPEQTTPRLDRPVDLLKRHLVDWQKLKNALNALDEQTHQTYLDHQYCEAEITEVESKIAGFTW